MNYSDKPIDKMNTDELYRFVVKRMLENIASPYIKELSSKEAALLLEQIEKAEQEGT